MRNTIKKEKKGKNMRSKEREREREREREKREKRATHSRTKVLVEKGISLTMLPWDEFERPRSTAGSETASGYLPGMSSKRVLSPFGGGGGGELNMFGTSCLSTRTLC